MTRCTVSLPLKEGSDLASHRRRMEELARRIDGMHPDVVIERVGAILLIVQVPDDLIPVIRHDLGCEVDGAPGMPLEAEGVPSRPQ